LALRPSRGDKASADGKKIGVVMLLAKKPWNVLRGLIQRYGTDSVKKTLWDAEFRRGRWDCLDRIPGEVRHPDVEKYANQGSILDLGCGPGSTGNELNEDSYQSYTGVDISESFIQVATQRTTEYGRSSKNNYVRSDMLTYVPTQMHDVILFGDSIYYIPINRILPMLRRYSAYLKNDGVFIANFYGGTGGRFSLIPAMIESEFDVIDRQRSAPSEIRSAVFRPKNQANV